MTQTRNLGDYTIIKQIGQGSMGSVFLAEHRFMKKQYLLKVLPDELSTDRGFVSRLEEDVGVISSLEHPQIVKVHNVSYASGHYFLTVDCIVDDLGENTNLGQYLLSRTSSLKEEEIYNILSQVADALDFAHSKKMVHRGLKLSNILIGKGQGSSLEVFVADFGLSRLIGQGSVLTRLYKNMVEALGISGVVPASKTEKEKFPIPPIENNKLIPLHSSFLQNFAFLAPEQRRLDSSKGVTTKSDSYAFGVLAYYLLMNEMPEGVFELPSNRAYRYQWDELIKGCLQSLPQKRPDSLIHALRAVKEQKLVAVEQPVGAIAHPVAEALIEQAAVVPEEALVAVSTEPPKQTVLKPVIRTQEIERPKVDPDPSRVFQIDHAVKHYVPERREVKDVEPLHSEMIIIHGGKFMRGSNDGNRDENPRHQITLSSFAIDIHPVTNEQFVRFLEVLGGEKDNNHQDIIRLRDSRIKRRGGKLSIESGYAKHPVVGVTWYGSTAYAKWIGKRLPTEAEWEISAQGGLDGALYPTGEDIEKSQANFFSADTTAVMSYAPNGYALYDMVGNVYEWCQDWYGYNYYEISLQEPEDPMGPVQGVYRVLRGGCWKSLKEDLRCSRRHRNNPGTVNSTYGFRCAADVQPVS